MKLTTKGRYAVSAMADIAAYSDQQSVNGKLVTLSDVSLRQGISLSYLEQLFNKLRKADLVSSQRGTNGGYSLMRPPSTIRISEIVEAVDEAIQTTACAPGSGKGCQGTSARCLTHDLWDELGRQIGIFLNAVTLEDVIERRVLGMASVNVPDRSSSEVVPL